MNDRPDLRGTMQSSARGAARSFRNRLRYRFDQLLSRGTWAVLLWLGAITLLVVVLSAVLLTASGVTLSGSEDSSLIEDFWQSLLRVLDSGTMAGDVGWGRRILALVVTITGLLIAGTLIGLIASGVEQRVDNMRRGRSIVVESNHYVVVGWSPRLRVVIDQLTKGDQHSVVVVLADRDAPEMDDELRPDLDPALGHRLVFRSGDPQLPSSLELANVVEARAIIVLPGTRDGDADVVTVVLTLGQMIGFEQTPIVVEVSSDVMRSKLLRVAGPNLHPVFVEESASRATALVLQQSGLSEVVEELMDAATPGVHVAERPELIGSPFGDAVLGFDAARPIGVIAADGTVQLNPPASTTIRAGDAIVAIAEGPVAITRGRQQPAARTAAPIRLGIEPTVMRLLFNGWNQLAPTLLAEFDRFAAPGSTAKVLVDEDLLPSGEISIPATTNFTVSSDAGSDLREPLLDGEYTSIVLLPYADGISAQEADGRTLLDLALLRNEIAASSAAAPQLLVQLLDADRSAVAEMSGLDGFLISDAIGSQLIAQFAMAPERQAVFGAIYDPTRASVHLVSPERLGISAPVAFADVVASAYASELIAVGWLTSAERGRRVVLSPALTGIVELSDQIVVIG